jgi:cell division protein FtsA
LKLPFFGGKEKPINKTPKSSYYYALDIGTEVLKVLLCQAKESGVEVLSVAKIPQQQKAMRAGVIEDLDTVAENLKLAINEVREKYLEMEEIHILREVTSVKDESQIRALDKITYPEPTTAIVGIAGELVSGISVVVNYDREDMAGKEINEEESQKIVQKVVSQVAAQGTEEISKQMGISNPDSIEIIHITLTGIEVDGTLVQQLEGFRGTEITIYLHASFAPRVYSDAVNSLMEKLNLKLISLVSQPFAIARAFSKDELSQGKIAFVDIGGGTSDIALAQGPSVIDTKMFAFGGRVFTKRIEKDMNIDYRHAELRKIKYSNGELDQVLSKKIEVMLKRDIALWVEGLRTAFEMIEDIEEYPDKIYLCGGGSLLTGLKEAVSTYPWKDKLAFRKHPMAKIITPTVLDNIYDKSGALRYADDVTPASLAVFAWDIAINPNNHIKL